MFEDKIYTAATIQPLSMENKTQNTIVSPVQSNAGDPNKKPIDSDSLDSTAQTGKSDGDDWQEEVYQKIKSMKESYLPELTEMHQKTAAKLQQHEHLPHQPESNQLEKLKIFKTILERLIAFLGVSKGNIQPSFKEKMAFYEKHIINFINTNRPMSSMHLGQLPPPHMHSVSQPQSQLTQVQSHENQMNSQMQSTNLLSSVPRKPQNNMASLQHNSIPSFSVVSTTQQNMINSMEAGANLDSSSVNSLQQVEASTLQQKSVNAPQQTNTNHLASQGGGSVLQQNSNPLQPSSSMLLHQLLKQSEEQQMLQNQQRQLLQRQLMLQQQQNMVNSMQPDANLDSSSVNSLQQVGVSTLQQNSLNAPQPTNTNSSSLQGSSMLLHQQLKQLQEQQMLQNQQRKHIQQQVQTLLSSQGGGSVLQQNSNPLQPGSSMLLHKQLKQPQEQQMLQNQQFKHIQQRQLLQRQQMLQQQLQHLQQATKQQVPEHMQTHPMSPLHQINDINEKMRQGLCFNQHLPSGKRSAYPQQQFIPGYPFPVSSLHHLLQAASPQIPQHSSPQVDQRNLPSLVKVSNPLQSANSSFVGPMPSPPLAPSSPMPGNSEKPISVVSSEPNASANIGHQQPGIATVPAKSLAIKTPGIISRPLLAEFSGPNGAHGNALAISSAKLTVALLFSLILWLVLFYCC